MNHRPISHSGNDEQNFHLDEHLCLDLLLGFLSSEEEERILSHLITCPACEKLLQERAAEGERLEATRVLRSGPGGEIVLERRGTAARERAVEREKRRLMDLLSQLLKGFRAVLRKPRFQLAGGLATAAVVLLLFAWFHYVRTPREPYLHLLPPYNFQLQTRETPETVVVDDLRAGLEAYEGEDFKRAVELLERAGASELDETHEMIRRTYLGSALAWRGRYKDAVEILDEMSFPLVPGEWGMEAQWTLYVALKESGRDARADSLLQILAAKPGGIGERARKLLKR
jgi:hypothetical protein